MSFLSLANAVLPDEAPNGSGHAEPFRLPASVLVVPSGFIGDNILLTPFLRNLRRNLGDRARLNIAATPVIAPLYETSPWIDAVRIERQGALKRPRAFLEALGYDTVMLCRFSPAWAAAAMQAGVPQRVGFDLERMGIDRLQHWGQHLTHTIPSRSIFEPRHQVEVYLDMLCRLGLCVTDTYLECPLRDADYIHPRQLLTPHTGKPRIVIHAAARSPGKQWPVAYWHAVLQYLHRRLSPLFISIGSHQEARLYGHWEREFSLLNLCGRLSLRESIALLQDTDLVITLDTAVAHMAALAGTPRLAVLYGPTNHQQWRPWVDPEKTRLEAIYLPLPCRPCMARTCEHKSCTRQLTPVQVLGAVERLLQAKPL